MKTAKLYSIGLIALMVVVFSNQASAQNTVYNDMFSNMLSNRIWDNIYEKTSPGYSAAKQKLSKSDSSAQASTNPVTPDRMNRAVQFESTGTRLMTQGFADGLGAKYKQDKAGIGR